MLSTSEQSASVAPLPPLLPEVLFRIMGRGPEPLPGGGPAILGGPVGGGPVMGGGPVIAVGLLFTGAEELSIMGIPVLMGAVLGGGANLGLGAARPLPGFGPAGWLKAGDSDCPPPMPSSLCLLIDGCTLIGVGF
jgi:hypothetical protein